MKEIVTESRVVAPFMAVTPLLVLVFMPRPSAGEYQFLLFPVLGILCLLGIFFITSNVQRGLPILIWPVAILFCFASIFYFTSELLNSYYIRGSGIVAPMRPLLHLLMFVVAVVLSLNTRTEALQRALYLSAVAIIFGQAFFSVFQIMNIPIAEIIYSSEKSRGIGTIFRITGTLANPNTFGMVIIISCIIAVNFGKNIIFNFILIVFSLLLIVASGSRSMLIVFPFAVIFNYFIVVFNGKLKLKLLLRASVFGSFIFFIIYYIISSFEDVFKYQAQIFDLIKSPDIGTVNSVFLRFENWHLQWSLFVENSFFLKWLFGLGSRDIFRVADNDVFYGFWHYGFFGLLITFFVVFIVVRSVKSVSLAKFKGVAFSFLFSMILLSWQAEMFFSWFYPLIWLYLSGIAVGAGYRQKQMNSLVR